MRFEDEEHEPVCVVRVMCDFALAVTLIVLMLVGTRSPSIADPEDRVASRAATPRQGAKRAELAIALGNDGKFFMLPLTPDSRPLDGSTVAGEWLRTHPATPGTVVVQFPAKAFAADLHRGLLALQSGFGTNTVNIQTIPAP